MKISGHLSLKKKMFVFNQEEVKSNQEYTQAVEASHFVAVKSALKASNQARLNCDFGLDFNADDLDFVMPKKPKVQIWQPVSVHEPDLKRKGGPDFRDSSN